MSTSDSRSLFLRRVETSTHVMIILKIVRGVANHYNISHQPYVLPDDSIHFTLHINKDNGALKLDYDPWSDINVIPDNSIDQKDIDAITDLAFAYAQQTTIAHDEFALLSLTGAQQASFQVRVDVLTEEEDQLWLDDAYFNASTIDNGASFIVRFTQRAHHTVVEAPDLERLLRTFIKLKL